MGKKILGDDYLLWIESAVAGTYNYIKGQGNVSISRSPQKVDTTSKDDGKYGTGAFGAADLGVALEIKPNLPDANGYTRLETLSNASPAAAFNIQVRKGGIAGGNADVVFQCSVYGNLDDTAFNQGQAAAVKASFIPAAPPTTDVLA